MVQTHRETRLLPPEMAIPAYKLLGHDQTVSHEIGPRKPCLGARRWLGMQPGDKAAQRDILRSTVLVSLLLLLHSGMGGTKLTNCCVVMRLVVSPGEGAARVAPCRRDCAAVGVLFFLGLLMTGDDGGIALGAVRDSVLPTAIGD